MIRINLLGIPKTKRGKRATVATVPSEGPSPVFFGLIGLVLAVAGIGYLYLQVNKDQVKLKSDLALALRENQRLSEVKATYEKAKRESEQFRRRFEVIKQLDASRSGPVDFLN